MPDDLHAIVQRMIDAGEPEENIAAVIKQHQPSSSGDGRPSSLPFLAAAGASQAIPAIASGSLALFSNPNVPKTMASAGRILGGLSPIVGGAVAGGGMGGELGALGGGLMGMAGAAKGMWGGGRTGWFTGQMLQRMAEPVAKVMNSPAAGAVGAAAEPLAYAPALQGDMSSRLTPEQRAQGEAARNAVIQELLQAFLNSGKR